MEEWLLQLLKDVHMHTSSKKNLRLLHVHVHFRLKMKNGPTPSISHCEETERGLFEPHSFPSQWQGWVGVGEEKLRWHIPEVESCTKPHLTRYFSGEHIRLSPIFLICEFIDKDTNIFELWAVVLRRQSVLYLCVLCGPDSGGQCDLFRVILWTTGRWQLKNEPL